MLFFAHFHGKTCVSTRLEINISTGLGTDVPTGNSTSKTQTSVFENRGLST